MSESFFFGEWVAGRRKSLDITQREFAMRTNYALSTIKKIETGERRPSRELAESIAGVLQIPVEMHHTFIECARGLRPVESLRSISGSLSDQVTTAVSTTSDNLPTNATPLIGRSTELRQIEGLLTQANCRLLTLVGTGGAGKTRLAIETARLQRPRFADGLSLIPLAAITDSNLLPVTIAQSLHLGLSGNAEDQLVTYLHDKSMLLVLDNFEQLLEGVGWLSNLLANAPGIKLLVTSREHLQLAEEWVYPVPILDTSQAVTLFEQTARRLNPHFELTDQVDSMRAICQLVENLPLAVELAASWTLTLSCEEIAHNIQRDIDFLSASTRNIPERHRSIRAVFDHSWRLLTPTEQDVMMRLSVFRGGWKMEEAEAIAGATLFILRSLIEKSLVRTTRNGRYDLHELVRQYAADQLSAAGKAFETRQQHAEIYLTLAGLLDSQLHTADGIGAFDRLDQELDNLRAGLSWSLENDLTEQARQYADKLSLYWWRRGHWAEGESWTKAVDARPDEGASPLLCWALMDVAFFPTLQGRFAEAIPYMSRAEVMAAELEDPETTLRILIVQVQARSDIDSITAAFEIFFSTADQVQEHSKSGLDAMVAAGHDIYGDRLRDAGRIKEAEAHYRQSLDIWRKMGNVDAIAYPIGNLGRLALQAGRVQEAYERLSESVSIARAIGNRVAIADWLPHLGSVLLSMGDIEQAEACYDEALALCEETGNQVAYTDIRVYLGYALLIKGEIEQARETLRHSLHGYQQLGEGQPLSCTDWLVLLPPEFMLCIRALALVNMKQGHFEHALTLLSAAQSLEARISQGADLGMQARIDEALQTLRSNVSAEKFITVWEAGQDMSPEAIIAYALESSC